ncbi:MAG: glycoside hydrolase family 127 protein [Brevefilum sp.]
MGRISSKITGGFWERWQSVNARTAIFHQWDQLERSGCIDNFRILAENKPVFRRGWFFADSDAYKWLEAACLILSERPDPGLEELVHDFIVLLGRAQDADGYLYTFNQIHFPGVRWVNLQIEHELYCHGHLIEAGVSMAESGVQNDLLNIARKAADRIVADFFGKGPRYTPGHQEIEIALLRLYEWTGEEKYLAMARQFLENRGKTFAFGMDLVKQYLSNLRRLRTVKEKESAFIQEHCPTNEKRLPPDNWAKMPPGIQYRWVISTLGGKFFQQHKPLKQQMAPVGHAVRYAYLQTAAAMLDRLNGDRHYLPMLQTSWDRMVSRRMYLTGGIGSLPIIEGFGRDYELDPGFAYAETCAALASLYWSHEMSKLTGEAKYSDLFEWQLYNAALVGMGVDGRTYLYNNPLESDGEIQRRAWYEVPCCPSNLSRTFVRLKKDILSVREDTIYIQQYITGAHQIQVCGEEAVFVMESQFPWRGRVELTIKNAPETNILLKLRAPSWATKATLYLNGDPVQTNEFSEPGTLDPSRSSWMVIERTWEDGNHLVVDFEMPVQVWRADKRVKCVRGRVALVCGPLIYCLEDTDNPDVDIFNVEVYPGNMSVEWRSELLGGCNIIRAASICGQPLTLIPYHLWGNRGNSAMTVFVNIQAKRQEFCVG